MQHHIEIKPGPMNVLAEQSCGVAFLNRFLEGPITATVFISQVDISFFRLDRITTDRNPFQNLMRIKFHQNAIVKRRWFRLVGINGKINRTRMILGQERPFQSGGKSCAAATP